MKIAVTIVAQIVVDKAGIAVIVVGVQDDNAVTLAVKIIVIIGHTVHFQNRFQRRPVGIMIAQCVVGGNGKIVI